MATHLPFQITVCGLGELASYRQARVSHVLSILDPDAPVPAEFGTFASHDRLELRFHDIIDDQPDMQCPRHEHIAGLLQFVQRLEDEQRGGTHLLVHCHAGFSRSPACAIVMLAKIRPDLSATAIIDELLRIRKRIWPNLRIIEIGDELLCRHGEFIEAARRLYGLLLERDPGLSKLLLDVGRGRELEAAVRPMSKFRLERPA